MWAFHIFTGRGQEISTLQWIILDPLELSETSGVYCFFFLYLFSSISFIPDETSAADVNT